MKQNRSMFLRTVLLASAGLATAVMVGSPRSVPRPLPNGVYAVLGESVERDAIGGDRESSLVLVYDRKYSEVDQKEPSKYVAIDTRSFVPLILDGPPETNKSDRGWTMLSVTLARAQVKPLEEFTRAHLGGRVAIVLDGEIVTIHKVRSVIRDGKAQITRCGDDACRTLLLKLGK
jgi:preprotein translocase subunit SecD